MSAKLYTARTENLRKEFTSEVEVAFRGPDGAGHECWKEVMSVLNDYMVEFKKAEEQLEERFHSRMEAALNEYETLLRLSH